jgi:hypothetical protein
VAVFAGVLAAALFVAAWRRAGTLAACVAVAALAFGIDVAPAVSFGNPDAIAAALVVLALALSGWPRVVPLVLAGLLRPEAWLVAGAAAFLEARGPVRRVAFGAAAAVLPALLWITLDLVVAGDAFATQDWREGRNAPSYGGLGLVDLAGRVWDRLTEVAHLLVLVLGAAGLAVHLARTRARDALPAFAAGLWILALAVERSRGIELNARYFLPAAAVLALGCGLLAGEVVPERFRERFAWPAAAAAVALVAVAAATADFGLSQQESANRVTAVRDARPALEGVLECGTLATTGTRQSAAVIPHLAAATRESLHDFDVYEPGGDWAGVLLFEAHRFERGRVARGLRRQAEAAELPPGPREATPLGPLVVSPDCA